MLRIKSNKAVRCFGLSLIMDYLQQAAGHYRVPVVSVGSGNGLVERDLENAVVCANTGLRPTVYCVDPDPESYLGPPVFKQPDAASTTALLGQHPELVGNCILFLNWPEPNGCTWDMEAVVALQPQAIIAVIERFGNSYGAAGGELLHRFLYDSEDQTYAMVMETKTDLDADLDPIVIWKHRSDLAKPEVSLPDVVMAEEGGGGCSLM